MAPQDTSRVVKLPAEVAANDAELHSVAARIFHAGPVRSMTVDGARALALVRFELGSDDGALAEFDEAVRSLRGRPAALPDAERTLRVEFVSWTDPRDGSISFIKRPARAEGWRKVLCLMLAAVALTLGLLGIVLPGLPTTPFVLLGSYFLLRGSTRLHERLITSRLFGGVLRDWHLYRGLRPDVRARAVVVVAIAVALSLYLAWPSWPMMLTIAALAACGLTVIWRLPTARAS